MHRFVWFCLFFLSCDADLTVKNPEQQVAEASLMTQSECVTAEDCHDGNWCTNNLCLKGKCAFFPKDDYAVLCNDGNACTLDWCFPTTRCINQPVQGMELCDDNDWCTDMSECKAGTCVATGKGTCYDGDPCTLDYCTQDGCAHKQIECGP